MKYKSEIYEAIHQDAVASFEVGAISEARMREYDAICLVHEPEIADENDESQEMARVTA